VTDNPVTFFSWLVGPHPTLRTVFIWIGILAVLGVIGYYVSWIAVAVFLIVLAPAFYGIRAILMDATANLLIVLDPDTPSVVGVHHIGRKKWESLTTKADSDLKPLVSTAGTMVMFCTQYDGKSIKASWIHEIDRTEFFVKSEIHTTAITFAETLYKEFTKIRDIPRLLSIRIAGKAIEVYEQDKMRNVTTLDPAFEAEDIMELLQKVNDPMDKLRTKEGMTDATHE